MFLKMDNNPIMILNRKSLRLGDTKIVKQHQVIVAYNEGKTLKMLQFKSQ